MCLVRRGYWPARTCWEEVGNVAEVAGPTRGMKGSGLISTRRRHATNGDTKGRITNNQTKEPEQDGDVPEHSHRLILSWSRRNFWKAFRGESLDALKGRGHVPNKVTIEGIIQKFQISKSLISEKFDSATWRT